MAKASGPSMLTKVLKRLVQDQHKVAARSAGGPVLERLLALVLQGDGPYAQADKAVKALRASFANWSEMRVARHYEVVEVLRRKRVPQAESRAERAQELLRRVFGLQNHLDLDWMDDCTSERREKTLVALQMAPPIASLVLDLDAHEGAELPVSVEHKRLFSRLGLVHSNPKDVEVAAVLAALEGKEKGFVADLALRLHARAVCDSKHPECRVCVLLDICPYGRKQLSKAAFDEALVQLGLAKPARAARKSPTPRRDASAT